MSLTPSARLLAPLFGDGPWTGAAGDLLSPARRERLVPLLVRLVAAGADLDDAEREQLLALEHATMAHAVTLEHHVLDIVSLLGDQGIGSVLLKGVAVAHLDYPDPSWRQFGDADVLVAPTDFGRALELLRTTGWRNQSEVPARHLRFTHALPMRHERGVIIDIHQAIGRRGLGRLIPAEVLLDTSVSFGVAGEQLRALAGPFRLGHACLHWTASRTKFKRLSGAADIIVMARRSADRAAAILEQLEGYDVVDFVRAGITRAFEAAEQPVPAGWAPLLRSPRRPGLVARAHLADERRPLLEEVAFLTRLGWEDWLAYLRGYVDVGDSYRAKHRRRGRLEQLRYLAAKARNQR